MDFLNYTILRTSCKARTMSRACTSTSASNVVGPSQIEILNRLIDSEVGHYRVRIGRRDHYLTIDGDVYDEDTMCRPYLLTHALPGVNEEDWTKMHFFQCATSELFQSEGEHEPLPAMTMPADIVEVDPFSLPGLARYGERFREVEYQGNSAINKIASWL